MDVVVFASAYWDEPLWTNKQHIAARLAGRGHRVLYVEPGFSRFVLRERLTGHRGEGPGGVPFSWCGSSRTESGVQVLSPLCLPLRRGPGPLLSVAWRILAGWIERSMRGLAFGPSWAYVVYYPEGVRLLSHLRPAVTLYDCVDDIASQPHIASRPRLAAAVRRAEALLVARASCVTATSRPLWERRRLENPCSYYVPNVGEYAHFARAQEPLAEPQELAAIPRPRVGFVGALDPYKVDYASLSALATKAPELSLVLAGPAETAGANAELSRLALLPNVHVLGQWPYRLLPELLASMDCLVLPYRLTEHTRFVFPLKFFEFLATGKPVVSAPLESLKEFEGLIPFASSPDRWPAAVRQELGADGARREARLALARQSTWDHRAARIEEILAGHLAGSPPPPG
ncbi:MAG: glycosyltransferase [Candidatus Wallbacteria bacterium]|nr:glycosyltransferase [Candidatus Wallbacteria bacterium]